MADIPPVKNSQLTTSNLFSLKVCRLPSTGLAYKLQY
jgi:hypothetical protein